MWLDKVKASGVHLFLSAIIIGFFLLIVYFLWYPYPLYITEGLSQITLILLGVDLVLGPIMTFILYKKGKKYLLLDLSIVVAIQFCAFIYGAITIADGRPAYLVFATDVYKTVSPSMIDINTLKNKKLKYSLFSGPIYIYATAPDDPKERESLMWSTLSGGKDIEQLPKYYQHYTSNLSLIRKKNRNYEKKLKQSPDLKKQLIEIRKKNLLSAEQTGLYPFAGNKKRIVVVINLDNGKLLDYLNLPF